MHYINSSRIGRWHKCRRKLFWNDLFEGTGLRSKGPEPEFLSTGKAAHHGLALDYKHGDHGPSSLDAAVAQWYIEQGIKEWEATEEQVEQAEYVRKLLSAYQTRKSPVDDFTVEEIEEAFAVPIGEVCWKCGRVYDWDVNETVHSCPECNASVYYLVGRIDLGVFRNTHFTIIDHKTTGNTPDEAMAAKYENSFQQIGYGYGYGKAHGLDIRAYGINFLQKAKTVGEERAEWKNCPVCNGRTKKEPTKYTCENCNQTGKVKKEIVLDPFRRYYYSITDEDVDRWLISTVRTVRDLEAEEELFKQEPDVAYQMNDSGCNYCQYKELCWTGDPQKWYNRKSADLDRFEPRSKDYVELIAEEAV